MKFLLITLLLAVTGCSQAAPVDVPAGLDHATYDRLLKKYVDDRGLLNYAAWKASTEDLQSLRDYTGKFAGNGPYATEDDMAASLINAYNALTIQWILDHYPVKTIKDTSNPWGAKRHLVGGRQVSLDEIEHDTLRPRVGYRIHACLVCAAKSCPPLRNAAFVPENLDAQLDDRMRVWLAREDLNRFTGDRAEVSKIFSWYGKDFPDLRAVLAKYAPIEIPAKLSISYRSYNWSLNDQPPATSSR